MDPAKLIILALWGSLSMSAVKHSMLMGDNLIPCMETKGWYIFLKCVIGKGTAWDVIR